MADLFDVNARAGLADLGACDRAGEPIDPFVENFGGFHRSCHRGEPDAGAPIT